MRRIVLIMALAMVSAGAFAQYVPTRENLEARAAFKERRLGIFLHWGIYSAYAQGEWYLSTHKLDSVAYMAAAGGFCPSKFDADAWAQAFADAGAGYVTLTSRHHDGFSMFGTRESGFNIVDGTPFGRDPLAELTAAVKARGMRMQYYYSLIDWIRPDYPKGDSGIQKDSLKASYGHYLEFEKAQIRELMAHKPGALWFDGLWDQPEGFDWRVTELYELIHSIDPSCLIGNNHHKAPLPGEDFQMFERDLPGENQGGFSANSPVSALPLETCETMNYAWGYRVEDQWYKPLKELVALLVKAVSKDANLLLNIGPMASGELPAPALERLQELGAWMREHGHTVNGCGSTGIPPEPWGVTTRDAHHIYVHILEPSALPSDNIIKVSLGGRTFYRKVPSDLDPVDTILEILVN